MKKLIIKRFVSLSISVLLIGLTATVNGQATSKGEMPQYLFPSFSKSSVLMKGGQINTAMLNYNTVTEKMVFINNEKYYDMTNPEAVDTVYLNERKFVPVGKSFYEVLISGPVALFIQHKGSLLSAGKTVGYGGTSQTASTSYISNIELSGVQYNIAIPKDYIVNPTTMYWIRKGDAWSDFTNEKQFLAIFPAKSSEIKSFIKKDRIRIDRPEDLTKLVRYCAEL